MFVFIYQSCRLSRRLPQLMPSFFVRRLIAMKWITPIWSDPVGWSEKVAKTKFRVCLWTVIHLCFVLFGLFAIYWLLQKVDAFQNSRALILLAVFAGAWPILFIGVGYPAMY